LLESIENPTASGGAHQLVRFNLFNFGEQPAPMYAIALVTLSHERLICRW
jgi:hypothetical protein